ncbi:ATP-grasp domain-containing protein [Helicobacter kayseriensis]|uniref:ATP-grasp domain-containing protein n=1 Tax=Helicobacter kayseriensis TaxID=2905877 RepID=UPI001E63F589|nr:ATP-grasp domain-containing protein [Helicobacter kayseriensis]MCE3046670.1 ATP-grasp domain-containing protein [Helicobacter kayseriensis]MCE3048028.1 ATP-grasp domain-containing protein [Helicobacter kayseriensis]
MNKLTILITTVGGLTSPDLIYALKNNGEREVELHGIDAFEWAVCRTMVNCFDVSPNSAEDERGFVDFIKNYIEKYHIDIIIPCGNEDNLVLAKYKDQIKIPILVGDYHHLISAYDKGAVYHSLQKHLPQHAPKFQIIKTLDDFYQALDFLDFPKNKIVIKPRFGRGGRGVYIIGNQFNFDHFFHKKPENEVDIATIENILKQQKTFEELIVMEYLTPPFVSAYSLCHNGENLLTLEHIREWGSASQTYRGVVSYNEELEHLCSKVIEIFNLTYANNMELAYTQDGRLVLFDLNPRLGASSSIDTDLGFNFPYLAIKLLLGEEVKINKSGLPSKSRFLRYFSFLWL